MWLKYNSTINRARNTTNIGFFALFSYILLRKWGEKTDILKKRAKFTHPPPSNWPPPSWDVEIVRNTRFDFLEKKFFFGNFWGTLGKLARALWRIGISAPFFQRSTGIWTPRRSVPPFLKKLSTVDLVFIAPSER